MGELLSVIIADDESIFRRYLVAKVDWAALDLQVCALAANGKDALQLIEQHIPNIALLDITMPYLDGLSLAKEIRSCSPDTAIIFLTGSNEFTSSQQALKLGAVDYILKPFDDTELIAALWKARTQISEKRLGALSQTQSQSLVQSNAMLALLRGNLSESEEARNRSLLGLPPEATFYCGVVEIDDLYGKRSHTEEVTAWREELGKTLDATLSPALCLITALGLEGRMVSLFPHAPEEAFCAEIMQQYERVRVQVQQALPFTVTVGLSMCCKGRDSVRTAYLQCLGALEGKLFSGGNRVVQYSQQEIATGYGYYSGETSDALLRSLRTQDSQKTDALLEGIFKELSVGSLTKDALYGICNGLISLGLSYVTESGHALKDVYGEGFSPFAEMRQIESAEALQAWLQCLYANAVRYCAAHRTTKSRILAQRIKKYIEDNCTSARLSVEQIAGALYMNPDYLRATFKKEMGLTILDYITNLRIERAKVMLTAGEKKLTEIADLCGFSDAAYFSRCFKKRVGIAPSAYEAMRHDK